MRLIDNVENAERCEHTKIKTHFAQIIVGGTCEKPCYNIMYFDPTDREYHIGFGSFCLEYVFKWLEDEFEIIDEQPTIEARPVVRPLEEWAEDYGDVLWWRFPIEEPPYVGSPLDCNWSGYHTHWTPIEVPEPPNCGADMRGAVE